MTLDTVTNRLPVGWKNPLLRAAFITVAATCCWQPLSALAGSMSPANASSTLPVDNTEASLNLDERKLIQEGLIWGGFYQGAINGNFDKDTRAAITEIQQQYKQPGTGLLNADLAMHLGGSALNKRTAFGWTTGTEPKTGVRLGYPSKLLTVLTSPNSNTVNLNAEDSSISLRVERLINMKPGQIGTIYNNLASDTQSTLTYNLRHDDSFITAGSRGPLKFLRRYEQRGSEIRALDLVWVSERDADMKALAILISNSFDPFNTSGPQKEPEYPYLSSLARSASNESTGGKPNAVPTQ
ncbi:peptidoglycan-binding domain-containing protein [Pseudomonas sp. Irchel 3A5]|uniref:peptidoglycan-binding domain-containing protein n=1 Tax=Pseudomonas sp. Irchel 3A5 TaxID=2008911 RepID=UPI0015953C84|nr:peptidoglycan-binding domain-containing protein [Pseudomonas sp. Irchel 3A5]